MSAPGSPPITPPHYFETSTLTPIAVQFIPSRTPSVTRPNRRPSQPRNGGPPDRRRDSPNPMGKSVEKMRAQRRDGFLNKVQTQRDGKTWELRGDQILQSDYAKERRAWEEQQARLAPSLDPDDVSEILEEDRESLWNTQPSMHAAIDYAGIPNAEAMEVTTSQRDCPAYQQQVDRSSGPDENEIDAILAAEAQELDALISMHDDPVTATDDYGQEALYWGNHVNAIQPPSPIYGSDDGEFEELLMGIANANDAMDMSED